MEYINIVDNKNNITNIIKEKSKAHKDGDFHRTVLIWIINNQGEILLQKRSPMKKNHPNQWDISAAGHVQVSENLIEAAKRELKEELGVVANDEDFECIGISKRDIPTNKEFQYNYILRLNKNIEDYIFEDNEVSEVKYIPYNELKRMVIEKDPDCHLVKMPPEVLFNYMDNKVKILPASKKHKDFIIYANKQINEINRTEQTTHLEKVIDEDLYGTNPKFKCLVAQIDEKPVGFILYSYFYWANDGEVLWISQMYIEKEYRKYGVFFRIIQELKRQNPDIHIASCATGNENRRMQKILTYYNAKEINLKFYYIKKLAYNSNRKVLGAEQAAATHS